MDNVGMPGMHMRSLLFLQKLAIAWQLTLCRANMLYDLECKDCDFQYIIPGYTIDKEIPHMIPMNFSASDLVSRYIIFPAFTFPFEGYLKSVEFVSEDNFGSFELSICREIIPSEVYSIDYSIIFERESRSERSPHSRNEHGNILEANVYSDSNKLSKATFVNLAEHSGSQNYDQIRLDINHRYVVGIGFTHATSQKNDFLMFTSSSDVNSPVLKMVNAVARESIRKEYARPSEYEFNFKVIPDLNLVPAMLFEVVAFCSINCKVDNQLWGRALCHRETGTCTNGCNPGWRGEQCDEKCPDTLFGADCASKCLRLCKNQLCDAVTGECLECEDGLYGRECLQSCGFCADGAPCSKDGKCPGECMGNYGTPMCTECRDGYFHINSTTCTVCGNCLNSQPCDKTDGSCNAVGGCSFGFQLPGCIESCSVGRFGFNCQNKCGHCKESDQCNFVTGQCREGCKDHWFGEQCMISQATSDVAMACDTASNVMNAFGAGQGNTLEILTDCKTAILIQFLLCLW